jgi:LPXTG-site transpeptidase (sortase) family protein
VKNFREKLINGFNKEFLICFKDGLMKSLKKTFREMGLYLYLFWIVLKSIVEVLSENIWDDRDIYKRRGINILKFVVLIVGLYILLYPIVPFLVYKIRYEGKEIYPYKTQIEIEQDYNAVYEERDIPEENRLVIPAIGVDMPIIEGVGANTLDLGIWRRPRTGEPTKGNMVLTGHRVGYAFLPEKIKSSTSFYNLDKLKEGDKVLVYWEKQEYNFEIISSEVVTPEAIHIEAPTEDPRLTLYTCHPIGQNTHRLVYYAELAKNY